jgi:hypothetical protein
MEKTIRGKINLRRVNSGRIFLILLFLVFIPACGSQPETTQQPPNNNPPPQQPDNPTIDDSLFIIPSPVPNDPNWSEPAKEHYWPGIGSTHTAFGLYNPNQQTVGALFIAYGEQQEPLHVRYVEIPGLTQFTGRITDIFPSTFTGWAQAYSTEPTQGSQVHANPDSHGIHPSLTNADISDIITDYDDTPLQESGRETLHMLVNPSQSDAEIIATGLDSQGNEIQTSAFTIKAGQTVSAGISDLFLLNAGEVAAITQVIYNSDSWIGGVAVVKNFPGSATETITAHTLTAMLPLRYSEEEISFIRNPLNFQERGFIQYHAPYEKRILFSPILESFLQAQANMALEISSIPASQMYESVNGQQALPLKADKISLTWDPSLSANIEGYKIYWGPSSDYYNALLATRKKSSFKISDLADGQYFITATAFQGILESAFSNEINMVVSNDNSGCDANLDSMVNTADLHAIVSAIRGTACPDCDIDENSSIDFADLTKIINVILGPTSCPK